MVSALFSTEPCCYLASQMETVHVRNCDFYLPCLVSWTLQSHDRHMARQTTIDFPSKHKAAVLAPTPFTLLVPHDYVGETADDKDASRPPARPPSLTNEGLEHVRPARAPGWRRSWLICRCVSHLCDIRGKRTKAERRVGWCRHVSIRRDGSHVAEDDSQLLVYFLIL